MFTPQKRSKTTDFTANQRPKVGNETRRRDCFCEKNSACQHIMIFLATFLKRIKKFG
jgi:hypothetical protein